MVSMKSVSCAKILLTPKLIKLIICLFFVCSYEYFYGVSGIFTRRMGFHHVPRCRHVTSMASPNLFHYDDLLPFVARQERLHRRYY